MSERLDFPTPALDALLDAIRSGDHAGDPWEVYSCVDAALCHPAEVLDALVEKGGVERLGGRHNGRISSSRLVYRVKDFC